MFNSDVYFFKYKNVPIEFACKYYLLKNLAFILSTTTDNLALIIVFYEKMDVGAKIHFIVFEF